MSVITQGYPRGPGIIIKEIQRFNYQNAANGFAAGKIKEEKI